MKKHGLRKLRILLFAIVLVGVYLTGRTPENCALCDHIPYHAPCLVNLSTGEIGELTVYDPHPFEIGEIAKEQLGGTFCFLY